MFSPPNSLRRFVAALLLLALFRPHPAGAIESVTILLGNLSAPGWQLEGVSLEIHWQKEQGALFSLAVKRIRSDEFPQAVQSIQVECDRGAISDQRIRCDQGMAHVESPLLDTGEIPLKFAWERESRKLDLHLPKVALSAGYASLDASGNGEGWRARVKGSALSLVSLRDRLAMLGIPLPEMEISGRIDLDLKLSGSPRGIDSAEWDIGILDGAFSDSSEAYLAEGVNGRWNGRLRRENQALKGTQGVSLAAGAVLTPHFYLAPEARPIDLRTGFQWLDASKQLMLHGLEYRHPGVLEFSANGTIALTDRPALTRLTLDTRPVDLESLFEAYLAPVLTAPFFEQLRLSGRLNATFDLTPAPTLRLNLQDVGLEQGGGTGATNIALEGLSGDLFWEPRNTTPPVSTLSWQGARLFEGIDIGAAQTSLRLIERGVVLTKPLRLPVMDGFLQAEAFELEATDAGPRLAFRGYLTPISMERVSRAAGWPVLAGELSGVIPAVSYQDEMLRVEGVMLIRAFDGRILIRDLRLDDLFGALPRLGADIELKALDLETLTRTFSFGKITGKLEGRVDGLRLENWEPVSFDARFATPEDDRSRHRISQKAVDNISNLGGVGMSGALSRSFLRVFEEFGYDRIGISCRLQNGVCEMGGVGPADGGYYLVRGGGIPRIDIVGFNRSTDWDVLIDKLKQIAEGGVPVVE